LQYAPYLHTIRGRIGSRSKSPKLEYPNGETVRKGPGRSGRRSTAVINQSLAGVVLEARKFSEITKVYGARHGVRGILNEDFIDLTQATTHNLEEVARTPASALGSTRDKPDEEYCRKMFKVMLAHEIRYFFYIGGNDSSDTCRIVNEQAKAANYELRTMHVPRPSTTI